MAHIPRRWLGLLAASGLLFGLSGVASADKPAILFRALGDCGSAPQPSSLTVANGAITITNGTGAPGTVEVDGLTRQDLDSDTAVNAGLSPGHHVVRFVLHCVGTFARAQIDVGDQAVRPTTAAPSPPVSTTAPPGAPPTAAPTADATVAPLVMPPAGATGLGQGERLVAAATGARSSSPVLAQVTIVPVTDPPVFFGEPFPVGDTGRGRNLLVVIALICVLGVCTAIIRVIVAQRTDRVIRTRQTQ